MGNGLKHLICLTWQRRGEDNKAIKYLEGCHIQEGMASSLWLKVRARINGLKLHRLV